MPASHRGRHTLRVAAVHDFLAASSRLIEGYLRLEAEPDGGAGGALIFPDGSSMTAAGATLGANTFNGDQTVNGGLSATGAVNAGSLAATGAVSGASAGFTGDVTGGGTLTSGGLNVDAGTLHVDAAGDRVGVVTTSPAAKLDVAGAVNASQQYNLTVHRVLGVSGTATFPGTNLFVGFGAGQATTPGSPTANSGLNNTFVGKDAGRANTSGVTNSFFGASAGFNSLGNGNSFFGHHAGESNRTDSNNTAVGLEADVFGIGLTNATAIGHRAHVTQSNPLVLGSIRNNLINGATADTNVGIGTPAPQARPQVQGGNVYVGSPGQGLILKSPDGATCRLLSIDNSGNLMTSAVAPSVGRVRPSEWTVSAEP